MRIKELDFLRGVAILLVLFRHSDTRGILFHVGWMGVDLFFVLSGFLVSGLIFNEYKKTGTVNLKRFLIRRGFKIYPSFYLLILISILVEFLVYHRFYKPEIILAEVFYLQNYFWGMWGHTWSIAVEEHFYLLLSIFAYFTIKYKTLGKQKVMLTSFLMVFVLTFLLRLKLSLQHQDDALFGILQTHLRLDGILTGTVIAYIYYFTNYCKVLWAKKSLLLLLSALLLAPAFIFDGGAFLMNAFGITLINLGFGLLVLVGVEGQRMASLPLVAPINMLVKAFCFIGVNSYSIYLWHLMSKKIIDYFEMSPYWSLLFYVMFSVILGLILAYLVEKPFLKIRDYFFEAKLKPSIPA